MLCDLCGLSSSNTKSAVIRGEYGQYCKHCIAGYNRATNSGHAQYSRDRDREDHARDMIQPWRSNGKPNRDFIREYPEEAKSMFSEKELNENG